MVKIVKKRNNLLSKCKKIRVVLADVDGVLTDGGMYYTKDGDHMKKFHVRDGMGVNMLRRNNIPTIIITKEENMIIQQWASRMNIAKLYQGIIQKESLVDEICQMYGVNSSQLAYIGDDVNDIALLKKVGLSATPSDGISLVRKICDYVCTCSAGNAAFRELADLILESQKRNK
jgi:YrbI family 3-deoxy-D-manno-octulosonate 8-phosphate phosphatase